MQNKKTICSYFTSKNGSEININTIKSYLKKYLPSYMIPTYIYQLDKMPLTVNGKIDKKNFLFQLLKTTEKLIRFKLIHKKNYSIFGLIYSI